MADPRTPSPELLRLRLRNARRLNVALAALSVFLLVIVFAVRSSDEPRDQLSAGNGSSSSGEPDREEPAAGDPGDPARSFADADHRFVIGDPDAPVVLNEWVDLRCPFCAVFTNKSLPTLIEDYVEPGLVRIEVHPVSFFGEDSTNGAVALHAAADQDRFFEYMTTLYAAAPDKGHPDHPNEVLLEFARDAGIPDLEAFEAALRDPDLRAEVGRATNEAQRLGVQAVPFFVVGDQAISGAQPLEVFESLLDQAVDGATAGSKTDPEEDPSGESADDGTGSTD